MRRIHFAARNDPKWNHDMQQSSHLCKIMDSMILTISANLVNNTYQRDPSKHGWCNSAAMLRTIDMCWIVIGIYSFTKLQSTQAQLLSYNKQTPKQAKKQTNQVFCRGCKKQEPLATSKRGCQARICVHAFHGSWGNKDFPRGALEAWRVTWAWRLRCSPVWCHAAEGGSWRTSTGHPAAVDGASGGAMMVGQPCKRAMIGLGQKGKKGTVLMRQFRPVTMLED